MARWRFGRETGSKRARMGGGRLGFVVLFGVLLVAAASAPGAWATCDCTDTATTGVPQVECEALLALFNGTDGPNWRDNTNWDTDTAVKSWYGVSISGESIIESIPGGAQLVRTDPAEPGDLNKVVALYLSHNGLNGKIPPQLGSLSKLIHFQLNGNQLTGSIALELGNLYNLTKLDLSSNDLIGAIPSELGNLEKLEMLDLGYNQLTDSIPRELGNLKDLKALDLSLNDLIGPIPPELGDLGKLNRLELDSNKLTEAIPQELGSLIDLVTINLGFNELTGTIPPQIGELTNLKTLILSSNRLTGPIPAELGNLKDIARLKLNLNQLTGEIPSSLTNLTVLNTQTYFWRWGVSVGIDSSWTNIGYNMLTASGETATFFDSKDYDWEDTQTVPPANLAVGLVTSTSVQIIWVPIPFIQGGGFYRVKYATKPGGPYTEAGTTANKSAANFTVTGLNPDTTHYFVVETFTPAHDTFRDDYQQNDLTSPLSAEISIRTLSEGEEEANLADAVRILQILTGKADAVANVTLDADFNNDGRLGLEDAIYILRVASQSP